MTKKSKHSMETRVAFVHRGGGATALRRIEKAGIPSIPTKREMERHIHPRRKRKSVTDPPEVPKAWFKKARLVMPQKT